MIPLFPFKFPLIKVKNRAETEKYSIASCSRTPSLDRAVMIRFLQDYAAQDLALEMRSKIASSVHLSAIGVLIL